MRECDMSIDTDDGYIRNSASAGSTYPKKRVRSARLSRRCIASDEMTTGECVRAIYLCTSVNRERTITRQLFALGAC